jgi:hypothetical protein
MPDPHAAAPRPREPARRGRLRAVGRRVAFGAEALGLALGAAELWAAAAEGRPPSRPGVIAFCAGGVALVASLLEPRVRAAVRRRRST